MNKKTGEACSWVARDLCSACLTTEEWELVVLPPMLRAVAGELEKLTKYVNKLAAEVQVTRWGVLRKEREAVHTKRRKES